MIVIGAVVIASGHKEENGQTGDTVKANPLAGTAKTQHDTGKQQGNKGFQNASLIGRRIIISQHKVVHGHDEEDRVAVYGCKACLSEVHEVKGKKDGAKQCPEAAFKKSFSD